MIIKSKEKEVESIKKFIDGNPDFNKLVIYGVCTTTEGTADDYLDVAVQTTNDEDADDDDMLLELYCIVDDITDGKFTMTVINSQYNTSNVLSEIEKGEVIYET